MRVSQRQNYHKTDSLFNISYFYIMQKISNFLSVPLRFRNRERKNGYLESKFEVRSSNYIANYTVLIYFFQYPLFSYKYKEIPVQLELLRLSVNKDYKLFEGLKNLENLKLKSKGNNLSNQEKIKDHYNQISNFFPFNS